MIIKERDPSEHVDGDPFTLTSMAKEKQMAVCFGGYILTLI